MAFLRLFSHGIFLYSTIIAAAPSYFPSDVVFYTTIIAALLLENSAEIAAHGADIVAKGFAVVAMASAIVAQGHALLLEKSAMIAAKGVTIGATVSAIIAKASVLLAKVSVFIVVGYAIVVAMVAISLHYFHSLASTFKDRCIQWYFSTYWNAVVSAGKEFLRAFAGTNDQRPMARAQVDDTTFSKDTQSATDHECRARLANLEQLVFEQLKKKNVFPCDIDFYSTDSPTNSDSTSVNSCNELWSPGPDSP